MKYSEELKEARRAKFRNDFFDELERVGIEREQFFDPVESGICSNFEFSAQNHIFLSKTSIKIWKSKFLKQKKVYYEKLHGTNEFLFDRADRFKIKMPLCDSWQKQIEALQKQIQQQEEQAARDRIG